MRGSGAAASLALALGNSGGLVVPAVLGLLLTKYGATMMAGLLLAGSLLLAILGTVIVRTSVVVRAHTGPTEADHAGV